MSASSSPRRTRRRWSLLLGSVLLLWAPASFAAPTAAMREAARHLMDEGKERAAQKDYARALEAYKSAHELMHVPTTGLAVARTLVSMNQLVEAHAMASEVAQLPSEEGEHPAFAEARTKAKDLENALAERLPKIEVAINGSAKSLKIDDKDVPLPLPGPVPVNPGSHVVSAMGSDDKQVTERIEVQERETKKVELTLGGGGAVLEPKPGDETEPPPPDAPSGDRTGFAKTLIYGGFGIAIVGFGVGAVTGGMTYAKANNVKPLCEANICAPESKPDLDSALTLASVSTIGFIAAGAGITLGVVGLVLPRKKVDPAASTTGYTGLMIGTGSVGYRGVF